MKINYKAALLNLINALFDEFYLERTKIFIKGQFCNLCHIKCEQCDVI